MNKSVRKAFGELDEKTVAKYASYWGDLAVKNHGEYFQRWLFAFCSVHTTWESNVAGFAAIKDYEPWVEDKEGLRRRLVASRCGLHNNRTEYIYDFSNKYWSNPAWFYPQYGESTAACRDRLMPGIRGLGLAKTSYALEMSFPLLCDAVCLDVHMLRLYGDVKAGCKDTEYRKFEADWVRRSKKAEIPSYIARTVYWDKLQGKSDSRYWSSVLE
jgi:hypothetical protein